ncbi:MAG: hypothetical protein U1C49_00395 [Candidatus Andersenbacteria bacterium]|nr:hypothetical protein [bacterium]MDZ4225284.1 hypothetical protein [Candidatus Andersenbacteria bacterium]
MANKVQIDLLDGGFRITYPDGKHKEGLTREQVLEGLRGRVASSFREAQESGKLTPKLLQRADEAINNRLDAAVREYDEYCQQRARQAGKKPGEVIPIEDSDDDKVDFESVPSARREDSRKLHKVVIDTSRVVGKKK